MGEVLRRINTLAASRPALVSGPANLSYSFGDPSFSWEFLRESEGSTSGAYPARSSAQNRASTLVVILFISPSAGKDNPEGDWAAVGSVCIPRQCPACLTDSIIGHGRRRKQAHDEDHDWISVRRGMCKRCLRTITFLPVFSLPYTHYSLIARSQALQRYFGDHCSLEAAAPLVKDPDRVPAASTVGRWFHGLDSAERWDHFEQLQPAPWPPPAEGDKTLPLRPAMPFPFLRKMFERANEWFGRGQILPVGPWRLSQKTLAHFLQVLLPLRC
jgi:hypothetical protein